MPNIKQISDLRNYTAVVNEVSYGNRVYLTSVITEGTISAYELEKELGVL